MSAVGLTLYRVVKDGTPTERDFLSRMMLVLPPRGTEREQPGLWTGLSMYDTVQQARQTAQRFPVLGGFIATVHIVGPLVIAHPTLVPGHYTVWAAPSTLLPAVLAVVSV